MPRRVLLLTPVFYGIEQKIRVALEESGYQVVWIENKTLPLDYHGTASKFKILRKFYFLLFSPAKRYLKEQLKNISDPHFDILFSINAHAICPYLFKYLKKQNPHLYSILYLWDSFSKFSWKRELRYFNRVLTFDPADSLRYNLEYKPNFYLAQDDQLSDCDKIDLFFVGKFSRNRLLLLDKIVDLLKSKGIKYFIKLLPAYKICCHNQFVYRILKTLPFNSEWVLKYLLNYEAVEGLLDRDFLIHDAIGPVDLQHKLLCSNVVLDLPFEGQTGYTHRFISALAEGKKIITTNKNVKEESFYDPDQIKIIDVNNPEFDFKWIKKKLHFPVSGYIKVLELNNWLASVFDGKLA